jgi:hypothetical protein
MKRWFIVVICLLALGASIPQTVQAQEKDAKHVATEVMTRSHYTKQPLGEVSIRLSGSDNRTLGHGFKRYKATEIIPCIREASLGNSVVIRRRSTLLRVESAYNWLNPQTSRFQRIFFRLFLYVHDGSNTPGTVPQFGLLEIIYPGGVVKTIGLDNSFSVTGTSLKQGYTLRGTVPGEKGDETLTVSFNLRGTGK